MYGCGAPVEDFVPEDEKIGFKLWKTNGHSKEWNKDVLSWADYQKYWQRKMREGVQSKNHLQIFERVDEEGEIMKN